MQVLAVKHLHAGRSTPGVVVSLACGPVLLEGIRVVQVPLPPAGLVRLQLPVGQHVNLCVYLLLHHLALVLLRNRADARDVLGCAHGGTAGRTVTPARLAKRGCGTPLRTISAVLCGLGGRLLLVLQHRGVQRVHIHLSQQRSAARGQAQDRSEDASCTQAPQPSTACQRTPMVRVLESKKRSRRASSRTVMAAFISEPPVAASRLVVVMVAMPTDARAGAISYRKQAAVAAM